MTSATKELPRISLDFPDPHRIFPHVLRFIYEVIRPHIRQVRVKGTDSHGHTGLHTNHARERDSSLGNG